MLKNMDLKNIDEKSIINIIKNIFKLNNIQFDNIKYYFKDFINFIIINVEDHIIKNIEDLKFYIINELNLIINNNEYLFNKIFNNVYSKINNDYKIIVIE